MKRVFFLIILFPFLFTQCGIWAPPTWMGDAISSSVDGVEHASTSSDYSYENCNYDYWIEYSGGYYYCKFSKTCNKSLTIHYTVVFPDGSEDPNGMVYLLPEMKSNTGRSYRQKGRIIIKKVKWSETN